MCVSDTWEEIKYEKCISAIVLIIERHLKKLKQTLDMNLTDFIPIFKLKMNK